MTEDGRPYGPVRLKEIIRERYEISKRINTSYNDIGDITPTERAYLLEFALDDIKQQNKIIEDANRKVKSKK